MISTSTSNHIRGDIQGDPDPDRTLLVAQVVAVEVLLIVVRLLAAHLDW